MSKELDQGVDEEIDTEVVNPDADAIAGMSDEEFMNQSAALEPVAAAIDPEPAADAEEDKEADTAAKPEVAATPEDKKPVPPVDLKKPADPKVTETDTPAAPEVVPVDYQAAYEKLTGKFKANGKDMQIDNVDDAIRLMQLGANYNKKMLGLKPGMRVLKLLENNGLMDEAKLNFLIDLDKKDPAAITKLLKDSKVDPLDIDVQKESTYKPTSRQVNDEELALDSVLEDLKDSPTYTKTLDVVTTKWDAKSRNTVAKEPQLLKVIDSHIASGVYDVISTELNKQRVLGNLDGLSDIEAYQKVGDDIEAKGGFGHLFQKEQPKTPVAPVSPVVTNKKVETAALNDKRRAAGSSKGGAPAAAKPGISPWGMSDEEFTKQFDSKFM